MNEPDFSTSIPEVAAQTQEAWDETKSRSAGTLRSSEAFVRENPLPAVLGALSLGLIIGYLARRPEPTFQERYLDAPLDELGKTLRALGDKTSKKAEKGAGVAAEMVHALADKLEQAFK